MGGLVGFVRMQRLSVLYSEHVPVKVPIPPPKDKDKDKEGEKGEQSALVFGQVKWARCGPRARWTTVGYYNHSQASGSGMGLLGCVLDSSLGEVVVQMCRSAEERCERIGCQAHKGEHERRWIHDGVRISADVKAMEENDGIDEEKGERKDEKDGGGSEDEHVWMWESCKVCGKTTEKRQMADGT